MCSSGRRKTNFGTSRTPSPTKAFTKNSQIVGAGVLDSPFFTIIYDFFDKLSCTYVQLLF